MPLFETLRAIHDYTRDHRNALRANNEKLVLRLGDVFWRTWDLGFTAFGGPPAHFGILHKRFVDGNGGVPWVDEQTVSFAIRRGSSTERELMCWSNSTKSFSACVRLCLGREAPRCCFASR
jgi:hypothetical protein